MKEIYFNTKLQQKITKYPFLKKIEKTTVVVFLEVKGHTVHLFNKVFSVLGAKKNPTRFSKYGSVWSLNDKGKRGGRLTE